MNSLWFTWPRKTWSASLAMIYVTVSVFLCVLFSGNRQLVTMVTSLSPASVPCGAKVQKNKTGDILLLTDASVWLLNLSDCKAYILWLFLFQNVSPRTKKSGIHFPSGKTKIDGSWEFLVLTWFLLCSLYYVIIIPFKKLNWIYFQSYPSEKYRLVWATTKCQNTG